ncbi:MAG: PIN domain-containing protein [Nanoarchaeota archaeon]|nr:PIN domain-containing protein [Nanoarchaeota archaeon]
MVGKYLLDTCIWRDFYENRFSKSGRPLGRYATDLFVKILKNKDEIIFSEALIWELKKDYKENEVNNMLNLIFLNKILINVNITKEEYSEAKKLAQERDLPFVDCLNAIHARNYRAILVSQDDHYLKSLSDISRAVRPEQIS